MVSQESSPGFKVRKLRLSRLLTQKELADITGISQEEVDLFEQNLPVRLEAKRKLLKELWATRNT
jgi:transcriptional regulator with XRE-family HTH domain